MKIPLTGCALVITMTFLLAPAAQAATGCASGFQQVERNNSIIMLGGMARGPVRQFILGEFGKDVNQQKRLTGEFDRCGVLKRANLRFDKQEGTVRISLVQTIEHVTDGWRSSYAMTVAELRHGQPVVINDKRGTTHYLAGKRGNITSSMDTFVLNGKDGFTETIHHFDSRSRLIRSVARGTDSSDNGEFTYRWDRQNLLVASESEREKMTLDYDQEQREIRLSSRSDTAMSSLTTQEECQLWDEQGNCTLSYTREMVVFPSGVIRRNITAAYRYEYWE